MGNEIIAGLQMSLSLQVIGMVALGITVGIIFGSLPGLTTTMAMAIFVPATYFMEPLLGISFLLGVYKGGVYGGSISAILISTPGTAAAAATVADGYAMARQGKAGLALRLALLASTVGETAANLLTIFLIGWVAKFALAFGVAELCALLVFSFTLIGMLSGDTPAKGFISAAFGLICSLAGTSLMTGVRRLTFGISSLAEGFSNVPVLIGLFALSEMFIMAENRKNKEKVYAQIDAKHSEKRLTKPILRQCIRPTCFGILVGAFIGFIPSLGQPVAALLNYGLVKETSKHPEEFGKGSVEGIVAAEAANNACDGPTLIPLLTFGIPGDTITAVLMGAFVVHGLTPGPALMENHGSTVYSMLWSMTWGNILLVIIALAFMTVFVKIVKIPKHALHPVILTLCIIGAFAVNNRIFDIWVALFFGMIGYFFKKCDVPLAPFVITCLLGGKLEHNFLSTMLKNSGNVFGLVASPIAVFCYLLSIFVIVCLIGKNIKKQKAAVQSRGGNGDE